MWVCSYCGNEASEEKRLAGCCGEVHFDEIEECPECGSEDTFTAHHDPSALAPECTYKCCNECCHQWNHG